MNFRLSEQTKTMLAKTNVKPMSKKQLGYYSSKKFYSSHPDFIPRDVYTYEGRVNTQDKWDKEIERFNRKLDREKFVENVKEYAADVFSGVVELFRTKDKWDRKLDWFNIQRDHEKFMGNVKEYITNIPCKIISCIGMK